MIVMPASLEASVFVVAVLTVLAIIYFINP